MIKMIGWVVLASVLVVGGLILATSWVERHPRPCDADCKALREAQWRKMAN